MNFAEILALLPLILEAAKTIPAIADIIKRVEAGEKIPTAEVDAAIAVCKANTQRFDDTPAG